MSIWAQVGFVIIATVLMYGIVTCVIDDQQKIFEHEVLNLLKGGDAYSISDLLEHFHDNMNEKQLEYTIQQLLACNELACNKHGQYLATEKGFKRILAVQAANENAPKTT